MTEPYEGREERDWFTDDEDQPEDEDDEYDNKWAIFMNSDPNTDWERTPHNRKALASGFPHSGDVIVSTTNNDIRQAKALVLSKAMGGFDARAGNSSRELIGNDTQPSFGGTQGNKVIGLEYKQVKVIVSTGKDKGVRLTTNEKVIKSAKFKQFKDLNDRSMEEFKTTSAGSSREAISRVTGLSSRSVSQDTIYTTEREGKEIIKENARDVRRSLKRELEIEAFRLCNTSVVSDGAGPTSIGAAPVAAAQMALPSLEKL